MAASGAAVVGCSEYSFFPPWSTVGEVAIPEATRKMLDVNDLNGALCLECSSMSFTPSRSFLSEEHEGTEMHERAAAATHVGTQSPHVVVGEGAQWRAQLQRPPWWTR